MAETDIDKASEKENQLEGGTYEVLKNRLQQSKGQLIDTLKKLNETRKSVFGSIESKLVATERITTEHNCVPRDMVSIGSKLLFGFNVHLGLKQQVELSDVFSVHEYANHSFPDQGLDIFNNEQFITDFQKLFKFYKETQFAKFAIIGPHLYMIFRIGKDIGDIKAFKWLIEGGNIRYLDNRSEHEFRFPTQHAFHWRKANREYHREGRHPHVSIEDKVFVETIGGDLTIKVEDNTDSGRGIYSEPVENADQTLDDAEFHYSIVGNLILLKIKPYQEKNFRYIVFNSKLQEARAIPALADSCQYLPDDQGIIFSNGYYLQNGDYKVFETEKRGLIFEKMIASPNGEDYLYIYYDRPDGEYYLLPYNVISQKVENQISCHGYAIYDNGELCYFNTDDEPKKHHPAKIWQTPFTSPDFMIQQESDSYLFKVGNKEVVKAMSECQELITLIDKGEHYENLYEDLKRLTQDVIDSYHWLGHKEAFEALAPLKAINETANSAIAEYDKVNEIKKSTRKKVAEVFSEADDLIKKVQRETHNSLEKFVQHLTSFRSLRGNTESLKTLRYADEDKIAAYEEKLKEENLKLADHCVRFLLRDDALKEYDKKVAEVQKSIEEAAKVVEIEDIENDIKQISKDLEMLIDIVSNLKISDATQTTQIIDNISAIFATLNRYQSEVKRKRRELFLVEGKAEFNAQIKLIEQGATNYMDLSDTPKKCDEYLAKLMVQLEELEGKFSEFEDFISKVSDKREEIYNAFETKKVSLVEAKNKRANLLLQSANRIISAAQSRSQRLASVADINAYFSTDLMIEKLRNITSELKELGDSVKADDIQSRLKSLKEDAIRQLRDKNELFESGEDVIKFGKHKFSVNTQPLEVTIVPKDNYLYFHLTGTNLYERIDHETINQNKTVWNQPVVSENATVYKAEYLAYQILVAAERPNKKDEFKELSLDELYQMTPEQLKAYVQRFMSLRYNEAYIKGVHDHDTVLILGSLLKFYQTGGLLRYSADARSMARFYWEYQISAESKKSLDNRIKGVGIILNVFENDLEYDQLIAEIQGELEQHTAAIFPEASTKEAAAYLFEEIKHHNDFVLSGDTHSLADKFLAYLKDKKALKQYEQSVKKIEEVENKLLITKRWLQAYLMQHNEEDKSDYVNEASLYLLNPTTDPRIISIPLHEEVKGLQGNHATIEQETYTMNFNRFRNRLNSFQEVDVPAFNSFNQLKKQLIEDYTADLRFEEFKPRIMSSFVRNKLINEVYLPLIGANLAKQIGEVGDAKRTDLMGMLLLISPPGYGKTTLMEYIANRLGVIFMKINGPAIGHDITSVDPAEAKNAAAREELKKLNLAFEMGDNVMIYIDDIQHCNPEFLQKFISLCDAQRKIEGVYKGKSKTYDFRGKKVSVVMAGNPYTESGEKFRIPDMLANRADIYNLGDIIGSSERVFKLSYLENCITSSPSLNKLAGKSLNDVYTLINAAEKGSLEGAEFETNHSRAEVDEYMNIFNKLFKVRDIIVKVNQEYIKSAGQADEYRTEPAFKLQGSYRDMNKIAEKVFPVMNEEELNVLIESHYENEAQTLTSGAEANLLKFKEMRDMLSEEAVKRWEEIKGLFVKGQKMKGFGANNQMGQILLQIEELTKGLEGIRGALVDKKKSK